MNFKSIWKQVVAMLAVIIFCALGARVLSGGETLSDYAENNPEAAYGSSTLKNNEDSDDFQDDDASNTATSEDEQVQEASANTANVMKNENTDSHDADLEKENDNVLNMDTDQDSEDNKHSKDSTNIEDGEDNKNSKDVEDNMDTQNNKYSVIQYNASNATGLTEYRDGFTYEELPTNVITYITGKSFPEEITDDIQISLEDLRYCRMKYIDFDGKEQVGEMIVNKEIADDVLEIFAELYDNGYQIETMQLIDDFDAEDEKSMEANNTSCFCYRKVAGTDRISKHSYGLAIDINPLYNPEVSYDKQGNTKIAPTTAEEYADRSRDFPYKITSEDLAYRLFTEHGFTWGGNWNSKKDYMHFEGSLKN